MGQDRRSLLATTGAGVASLLAGCVGGLGIGNDDGTDEAGNKNDSGGGNPDDSGDGILDDSGVPSSRYYSWVPAPEELNGSSQTLDLKLLRPTALEQHADDFRDYVYRSLRDYGNRWNETGVDWSDTTAYLYFNRVQAVFGSFSASAVGDELTATGASKRKDYAGATIFTAPEEDTAWAVRDGVVVHSQAIDAVPKVETVLDAERGDATRFSRTENGGPVTDRLGEPHLGEAHTMPPVDETDLGETRFEGQVGTAQTLRVHGAESEVALAILFERAEQVDTEAIRRYTEREPRQFFRNFNEVTVVQSGRFGIATGTVDTEYL